MKGNNLKLIEGKKIRRQFFTIPLLMYYAMMPLIPLAILIISVQLDRFVLSEWLSSIWMSVWIYFCFSLPWLILKVLNCFCFGKIVCVLTDVGIHSPNGLIEWGHISRIEYIIDIPPKYRHDPSSHCRAVLYTDTEVVILVHAPYGILRTVKRYAPQIPTALSNGSKWLILCILFSLLLLYLILLLI